MSQNTTSNSVPKTLLQRIVRYTGSALGILGSALGLLVVISVGTWLDGHTPFWMKPIFLSDILSFASKPNPTQMERNNWKGIPVENINKVMAMQASIENQLSDLSEFPDIYSLHEQMIAAMTKNGIDTKEKQKAFYRELIAPISEFRVSLADNLYDSYVSRNEDLTPRTKKAFEILVSKGFIPASHISKIKSSLNQASRHSKILLGNGQITKQPNKAILKQNADDVRFREIAMQTVFLGIEQ